MIFYSKISLGGGSLERTAAVRLRLAGAEPSEGGQRAAGALVGGQSRREEAPRPPFLGSFSSFVSTLDPFFSLIFNGTLNIYFLFKYITIYIIRLNWERICKHAFSIWISFQLEESLALRAATGAPQTSLLFASCAWGLWHPKHRQHAAHEPGAQGAQGARQQGQRSAPWQAKVYLYI